MSPPRHAISAVAFGLIAMMAGCGGTTTPTPVVYYSGGDIPGNASVFRIMPGSGISNVALGNDAGYFITANVGSSYRIVWTGDVNQSSTYRHFTGSAWTTGSFLSTNPGCSGACTLESDDYVSAPIAVTGGQRVDWDTYATDGFDGFDFVVDTEPVYIAGYIDDADLPDHVYFPSTDSGGNIASVDAIPFALTTQ